jgi:hypothetical protein
MYPNASLDATQEKGLDFPKDCYYQIQQVLERPIEQYSGQILGTNARIRVLATLLIELMNEKSKVSAFF